MGLLGDIWYESPGFWVGVAGFLTATGTVVISVYNTVRANRRDDTKQVIDSYKVLADTVRAERDEARRERDTYYGLLVKERDERVTQSDMVNRSRYEMDQVKIKLAEEIARRMQLEAHQSAPVAPAKAGDAHA